MGGSELPFFSFFVRGKVHPLEKSPALRTVNLGILRTRFGDFEDQNVTPAFLQLEKETLQLEGPCWFLGRDCFDVVLQKVAEAKVAQNVVLIIEGISDTK